MKKRIVSLVVVVCIMLGFTIPAEAAYAKSPAEPLADILYAENLFKGTGMTERDEPIYQLYGSVTRAQAITMLVRILGKESEALANQERYETPFTDVPAWAAPSLSSLCAMGVFMQTDNKIEPLSPLTRGDTAVILSNFIEVRK